MLNEFSNSISNANSLSEHSSLYIGRFECSTTSTNVFKSKSLTRGSTKLLKSSLFTMAPFSFVPIVVVVLSESGTSKHPSMTGRAPVIRPGTVLQGISRLCRLQRSQRRHSTAPAVHLCLLHLASVGSDSETRTHLVASRNTLACDAGRLLHPHVVCMSIQIFCQCIL